MFREYLPSRERSSDERACTCTTSFETTAAREERSVLNGTVLTVDADDCSGDGRLATSEACRATVVDALSERDAALVRTTSAGRVRTYADDGVTLLLAAGRFCERAAVYDDHLTDRARRDPLGAARAATDRAGPVSRIASETGLTACAAASDGYDETFSPEIAPAVALGRVDPEPPPDDPERPSDDPEQSPDAHPTDRWELESGSVVQRFERDKRACSNGDERACGNRDERACSNRDERDVLHLTPASATLDDDARRVLDAARERLATGEITGGDRAPWRAVRAVCADSSAPAADPQPIELVAGILRRHTRGCGFLTDLLAVPGVTDLSLTAPITETPVRARIDGEPVTTNVRFSRSDAATLASRVRAESGRGLSRASPAADATLDGVRVAAVTDPASDGPAFAFRQAREESPWTLARLVRCDTLPPRAAALLSLAVERGAAGLVAGPRGAGKTTVLGALLWALPPTVRTIVVEDTPELPVSTLQARSRDVQRLSVETGSKTGHGQGGRQRGGQRGGQSGEPAFTPTAAVRTALRLGEGALVVGEVRGTEAAALYEAMRVGAAADAVLGTIHGTGAATVRERVVSDLGVPESTFAATDFVLTLDADHRLSALEEVYTPERSESGESGKSGKSDQTGETRGTNSTAQFTSLFDRGGKDGSPATGTLQRGNSRLLVSLARPEETYGDVLGLLQQRASRLRRLAQSGRTDPSVRLRDEVER